MKIAIAESDDEILACFPVMRHLREHLADPDGFLRRVREQGWVCLSDREAVASGDIQLCKVLQC